MWQIFWTEAAYNNMVKSTGHHTVLTEEVEEDIKICIITMKNQVSL